MTRALELLAMMNPKGVQIGQPAGGVATLTPEDVAHALALANLPYDTYALLNAKYIECSPRAIDELCRVFAVRVANIAVEYVKRERGKPRILNLSAWVVGEHLGLNRCPACGGSGLKMHQSLCGTCEGAGRLHPTDSWMCEHVLCGLDRANWKRGGWDALHRRLGSELEKWESDAVRGISAALAPRINSREPENKNPDQLGVARSGSAFLGRT